VFASTLEPVLTPQQPRVRVPRALRLQVRDDGLVRGVLVQQVAQREDRVLADICGGRAVSTWSSGNAGRYALEMRAQGERKGEKEHAENERRGGTDMDYARR
jgi:hypothetical protein